MTTSFSGFSQSIYPALKNTVTSIASSEDFATGEVGMIAVDTKTGEVLAEYNPDITLIPASNTKLFSTAAALELYGPSYRHTTSLYYIGKLDNGLLRGNIIIKGGGDPSLGSRFFDGQADNDYINQFVESVKLAGIRRVEGDIIADASFFDEDMIPPTWCWGDLGNYYGAVPSGLTVNDNMIELIFNSETSGKPAVFVNSQPAIPGLKVKSFALSANIEKEQTDVYCAPYSTTKIVRGFVPCDSNNIVVKTIIPDPAVYIARQLQDSLAAHNIIVFGQAVSAFEGNRYLMEDQTPVLLCNHQGVSLDKIIEKTNTYSVNLFAEHCLALVGLKQIKCSRPSLAADAEMQFWKKKGLDIKGMSLNDGSGLSRHNTISPRQFAWLLTYMKTKSSFYAAFNKSLTKCGCSGTMATMCRGTKAWNNARGKSGSIRRVKAYSGYVTSQSGRDIAFSIIINNFNGSSNACRAEQEKFIAALAEFNN